MLVIFDYECYSALSEIAEGIYVRILVRGICFAIVILSLLVNVLVAISTLTFITLIFHEKLR